MGIQKPFIESFTQAELMLFIDHYIEKHEILQVPGHSWADCDMLARFLGFNYSRKWSQDEKETLRLHYPYLGAEETSKLLPLRSPLDCVEQARHLGLKTLIKKPRKASSSWMIGEIEILEKYYAAIGYKVSMLLPERSEAACATQAQKVDAGVKAHVKWSNTELEILQKYYPKIGLDVEDFLPGKSRKSIYARAALLNLESPDKWTPEEDELLRLHYPQMGKSAAKFFLGRRTETACIKRAGVLGLTYDNNRRPWSEDELSILDEHYPRIGPKVSEMLLGRSIISCQKKAAQRSLTYRSAEVNRPRSTQKWSSEELKVLQENYPHMGPEVNKLLPSRTKMACIKMAASLGLAFKNSRWSEEEDNILRRNYPEIGIDVAAFLPGRTESACQSRAKVLNISRENVRWSSEEDDLLKKHYPAEGARAFQRLSNRSETACQARVTQLGIQRLQASVPAKSE